MEKFAVDLEKVLDDFEYNEEREENVSVSSIKNPPLQQLGALRQAPPIRPPAASYRRPSFEPINLADADFAASPPKSSNSNFNHGLTLMKSDTDGTYAVLNSKPQLKNRNYANTDDNMSSLNNELNINKQLILESEETSTSNIWQNARSSLTSEEKPDLLEYNAKNADFDSNLMETHNQLPDITTSVRTSNLGVNNNEGDNLSNSLDLISSTSVNLLTENNVANLKTDDREAADDLKNYSTTSTSSIICDANNMSEGGIDNCSTLRNEPTDLVQTISDVQLQDYSIMNSNKQANDIIAHTDFESTEDPRTKTKSRNRNDFEEHNHNQLDEKQTFESSLEKDPEEDIKEEDSFYKHKGDFIFCEPKIPIGFTSDSDVSESELEEYLKELEVLESIDFKDKSFEMTTEEHHVTPGENYGIMVDKTESNSTIESITKVENNHSECTKGEIMNRLATNSCIGLVQVVLPTVENRTEKSGTTYRDQDLSEKNNLPDVDLVPGESHDSLQQPHAHKPEINSKLPFLQSSTNGGKLDEISTVNCIAQPEETKSNPFEEDDSPEATLGDDTVNCDCKSTNPFDEDDCGYTSDQVEVTKRNTNPFEEDCEDANAGGVPESSVVSKLHNKSIGSNQVMSKEPSSACNSGLKKSVLTEDKGLGPAAEPISSLKSSEERSSESVDIPEQSMSFPNTNEQPIVNSLTSTHIIPEENATECLPSCSLSNETFNNSLETSAKMIPIKTAVESTSEQSVDEAGIPAEEDKPLRPNSLELPRPITVETSTAQSPDTGELEREALAAGEASGGEERRLGKVAPFWVPDTDATVCMQCQLRFTVIKRRHHCRACGQVLCYKCCRLKARLEYMTFAEARVCQPCFTILEAVSASESTSPLGRQPNPNNPMEYCSTIPPLQQAAGSLHQPPPSVMVPVGVLKREGRIKSDVTKQVMFSDGIRPGGDLTELDGSGEPRMPFRRPGRLTKRVGTPPGGVMSSSMRRVMDPSTHSFIPAEGDSSLPPVVSRLQGEVSYSDLESPISLNQPTVKFALNKNLFVVVKRVLLDCCVNRECWCFSSEGLACVGQDEIVFLLECLPQEILPPKDVFLLINSLYQDAAKGSTVSEMSFTPAISNNLLDSRDHGGFLYIRTSYQCTAQLSLPSPPYLVALLIHRWETPWARLFPIRLVLRLGAEFRYYPCPLVSVRNRPPLYTDIGHTIINILADFRKYSYSLPSVRGLVIHMEDRQTTINIPRNRYDQVVRALNNSNDSVLAFGANLSLAADSHLVCMQSTEDENTSYHTQAINIHNKPRKVTGASFVVFNGALKVPGLAGKSNIVEDGLMVQVPSETMVALRTALRDMRDYSIGCGPNAEETVMLQWTADDTNFNIGVKSCIDGRPMDGVPSIRVHNGTDYSGGTRIIRWTEVFLLQCEDSEHSSEPLDISRLSESIARASCLALVPLLDLLSAASLTTLAVRTTIHPDNVGYEAGSNGEKLPPLYMKSLDDELVAVVHQAALASQENPAVLELVFRIMEQG